MGLPETMIRVKCSNSSQEAYHKERKLWFVHPIQQSWQSESIHLTHKHELILPQIFVGCNVSGTRWPWFSKICTYYVVLPFGCVSTFACLPKGMRGRRERRDGVCVCVCVFMFYILLFQNEHIFSYHIWFCTSFTFLLLIQQRCSTCFNCSLFFCVWSRMRLHMTHHCPITSSLLLSILPSPPLSLSHASHQTLITSTN